MRATLWSQAFARRCFGSEAAIADAKRENCNKNSPFDARLFTGKNGTGRHPPVFPSPM